MLSQLSLRIIGTVVDIGVFFRVFPWKWDQKNLILTMNNKTTNLFGFRVHNLGFKLVGIMFFFNFWFNIVRILQSIFFLGKDFQNIMFQLFVLSVSFLGLVLFTNTYYHPVEIAQLYTMIIHNDKKFTELFQTRKIFDPALPYLAFFGCLAVCEIPALIIVYLANTNKPAYLGSLKFYVPREHAVLRQTAEIVFAFYEIEIILIVVLTAIAYAFAFICFLQTISFWTGQLSPNLDDIPLLSNSARNNPKRHKKYLNKLPPTRKEFRDFSNAKQLYRRFQLLTKYMNMVARIALTGQHFAAGILLVTTAFSTIHFWGWHNFETIRTAVGYLIFPAAVVIFAGWIILIQPQPAKLKDRCPVFRATWRYHVLTSDIPPLEKREAIKFLDSCSDMVFYIGIFFPYELSTMPAVMEVCLDNLVTLLLASA